MSKLTVPKQCSVRIHIYMQIACIGDIFLIPGDFSFENFLWLNLKSDNKFVVTEVVVFDSGYRNVLKLWLINCLKMFIIMFYRNV